VNSERVAGATPAPRSGSRDVSTSLRRYGVPLGYGRRHWRGWLGIVVGTLASTGVGLLAPLPLKVLVDNVLGSHAVPVLLSWLPGSGGHQGLLAWVVVAEILVFVAAAAIELSSTFLWVVVGQGMVYELARDIFARVQRRSLREHLSQPVGDTLERVTGDSWSVHTVVEELVFTPLHCIITIAGVSVVLWRIAPSMTLVALATAPLMALTPLLLGHRTRTLSEEQRQVQGRLHSHIQQTLAGMPVVQAFGQEERQHRLFGDLAQSVVRLHTRGALLGGVGALGSGLVTTLGAGVITFIGAHQVLRGHLSIGALLVVITYVGTLQSQIGGLAQVYTTLQGSRASIDRVVEVLDAEPDVADRRGARSLGGVRGEVTLEEVWFGYEPARPVLRGVSLVASPGEVVAIVGPTGAGKSTLVGLVPRFFDPDRGCVRLDAIDVRDLRLRQVRASVSLVLQESFLFPFSIAENIAYGRPGASLPEVEQAAQAANAHDFITRLPQGYDTVVGERGQTLSGGERQRVAIARALLKDAPVLILDEPTSALDAETEGLLLEALDRLMAGRTTLIIAHRLSTIRRANQILVLQDGQIIERGRHDQLVELGGHYARMHSIQQGTTTASHTP
jgi:ATP-binding cassette subfamily B protein/subfamily B ATP-binding cassette protein MsbA